MKIIGITGGTGAGKTTALAVLESLDAVIVDADAVYHRLTEESAAMRAELEARFGAVYDEAGRLERKKLGKIVFNDKAALEDLNRITHKHVSEAIDELIASTQQANRTAVAIDAIELISSGLGEKCDATVAVTAPRELRIRRIMAREGITEAYARLRVEAQREEAYFRQHCDYELENRQEDSLEVFSERARILFQKILSNNC